MVTPKKRGRPKLDETRVMFAVRVAPATVDAIVSEADRREIGRGALLDEMVAKHIIRRRKT